MKELVDRLLRGRLVALIATAVIVWRVAADTTQTQVRPEVTPSQTRLRLR